MNRSNMRWWWVPGVACIMALLQLLRNTVTPAASQTLSFDGDVALHVLLGQLMWAHGGWLPQEPTSVFGASAVVDPGAWTPWSGFIAHEWLSEVGLALLWSWWGPAGPMLWTGVWIAGLSAVMFRRMLDRGAGVWSAVIAMTAAMTVLNGHLHPRPHILSWALAFVVHGWLVDHREGRLSDRAWWGRSAGVVLLWAQLHAGFLVLAPMLALEGVGTVLRALGEIDPKPAWRRLGVLVVGGVGLLLVSGINPWGFALHTHFLAWLGNDYLMNLTTEFRSPDFKQTSGWFFAGWMGLVGVALAAPKTRPRWEDAVTAAGFLFLALSSARHGAMAVLLTAVWVATRLHEALRAADHGAWGWGARVVQESDERLREAEALNGGWATAAGVLGAVVVAVGVMGTPKIEFDPTLQPVGAADWIAAHPEELPGQMFNPFRWGAYLALRLYPERRVYMNSWHDHLGEDVMRTYMKVDEARGGWQDILAEAGVGWVIAEYGSALHAAIKRDPSWERVYRDDTAVIFRRVGAGQVP
jgi:hypothetical protein